MAEHVYEEGSATLWFEGENARLRWRGQYYDLCVNDPGRAIREAAKLNRVDFRIEGHDPAWFLEINTDRGVSFVTDFGERFYHFAGKEVRMESRPDETFHQSRKGLHQIRISLTPGTCPDSLSGEEYGTIVIISFNDREFRDCGGPLH